MTTDETNHVQYFYTDDNQDVNIYEYNEYWNDKVTTDEYEFLFGTDR